MPFGLTSLERFKRSIRMPTDNGKHDDWLSELIQEVTLRIEHYCNRVFTAATVTTEDYDGHPWMNQVVVKRYPIDSWTNLYEDTGRSFATAMDTDDYVVYDDSGIARLKGTLYFKEGLLSVRCAYVGGYNPLDIDLNTFKAAVGTTADMPIDITQAANRLVAASFQFPAADLLKRESAGDWSGDYAVPENIPPAIKARLAKYQRVVLR